MEIIDDIIENRFMGGTIALSKDYADIVEYINLRTPTAYGKVSFTQDTLPAASVLLDTEGKLKILSRISNIQGSDNYKIRFNKRLEDFVGTDERLRQVLHGGSASQILLVERTTDKHRFIRKVAARYGVEGNGSPKLHAEIEFLLNLDKNEQYAGLRELYPQIYTYKYTDEFITLDEEYFGEGSNVLTLIAHEKINTQDHSTYFDALLAKLVAHGYRQNYKLLDKTTSLEQLEDYYLRRSEGRIRFLRNCGSFELDFTANGATTLPNLADRGTFLINDTEYMHPAQIIAKIRESRELMDLLRPRAEGFCSHGDLTFLNMVFDDTNKAYRLIDNRGHIGGWDPLYDIGKLKFTLSGFGQIMNDEFELREDSNGFNLKLTGTPKGIEALQVLNESFFDDVIKNEQFKELVKDEPHWKERILFAEAVHYLADIPYRLLLDQSAKNSVAVLLLGTVLLNELYYKVQE